MRQHYPDPYMAGNLGHIITNNDELRIVMVGKTGAGKSASGNTILGEDCFESKFSAQSMTVGSSKRRGTVGRQKVAVIDTPGFFDTRFSMQETAVDISQCITYASPGPHVFLVVIRLGRFTEEEKQTVQRIQEIFGQAADRYSMVLFTGGDELEMEQKTIEDFLAESPDLQELVTRCNNQYHVFNNRNKKDHSQVTKLLQKIREIVQKNGGAHYTNEMFQEAERAVDEEKERIMKEKEEEIQNETKKIEKEIQQKFEREMKTLRDQLQADRERERRQEREMWRQQQMIHEMSIREREAREAERMREKQEKERELYKLSEQYENNLREVMRRQTQEMNEQRMKEWHERQAERMRERGEKERELYTLKKQCENDLREKMRRHIQKQEMNEQRMKDMNERQAERMRELLEEKERELKKQHERCLNNGQFV
ncbi:GTPase IMAP family member 4-like [Xyrichtys novacula]|uniref:GTPase IMAP family member 4-like n=1 Tax=Xyrichtys novacula TaxID=13765 RepID=A0AAV1H7E4_XYRNO|nr:GTPase IMAP family member 4-like [Xyrichtys novacula]